MTVGRITFSPTPGPWRVSDLDSRTIGPVRVLRAKGKDVPQLQAVAVVKERTGETDANARLIAAAPELLSLVRRYSSTIEPRLMAKLDTEARALLAQIDGQPGGE